MDRLQLGLIEARTVSDVGRAVGEAARRNVRISGLNFFPLGGGIQSAEKPTFWSDHREPEYVMRRSLDELTRSAPESGPHDLVLAHPRRTLDLNSLFGPDWEKTETYNDFWRDCRIERQVLAVMGPLDDPQGFICFARTREEAAFASSELRTIERIRRLGEIAMARVGRADAERGHLEEVLLALEVGLPVACALFDGHGRLVWLNREALTRFGVSCAVFGSTRLLDRIPPELERWRGVATAAIAAPMADATPDDLRVRVLPLQGSTLFALVSARTDNAQGVADATVGWSLTPMQAHVLELVLQGLSNKEIAASIGRSVKTVEFHVKALLCKAGADTRTVLMARFWGEIRRVAVPQPPR